MVQQERVDLDADTHAGLGRVLVGAYLVLAVAATGRSVYQILRRFDEAPVAYLLSAAAALVYVLASIAVIKRDGVWRAVAWVALSFELAGVFLVGGSSVIWPHWFGRDDTVWSGFGAGYLWVPLALPVLGMVWLRKIDRLEGLAGSAGGQGEAGGASGSGKLGETKGLTSEEGCEF